MYKSWSDMEKLERKSGRFGPQSLNFIKKRKSNFYPQIYSTLSHITRNKDSKLIKRGKQMRVIYVKKYDTSNDPITSEASLNWICGRLNVKFAMKYISHLSPSELYKYSSFIVYSHVSMHYAQKRVTTLLKVDFQNENSA